MSHFWKCPGPAGAVDKPHAVHISATPYLGMCRLCAVTEARVLAEVTQSVPVELVQALIDDLDETIKNWNDEIRGGQIQAQEWAQDAADRARADADRYERGGW